MFLIVNGSETEVGRGRTSVGNSLLIASRSERIEGLLLGMAVADAVGLPYEGIAPKRASRLLPGPVRPRLLFGRSTFSDDTEHACMTALALIRSGGDERKFLSSLARQLKFWLLSLPPATGLTTAKAILRLLVGVSPHKSGVMSAGNGPAMRAPIIGAVHSSQPELVSRFTLASTRITHRGDLAEQGAQVISICASIAIESAGDINGKLVGELAAMKLHPELRECIEIALTIVASGLDTSQYSTRLGLERGVSGYMPHTVGAVLVCWLSSPSDYRKCVESAIALGGDADTIAAITGALAGAVSGAKGIPVEWSSRVVDYPRTVKWVRNLAISLVDDKNPRPLFWPAQVIRNLLLLVIVLLHGFRRLLPPY